MCPYGSFDGKAQVELEAEASPTGGWETRRRRRRGQRDPYETVEDRARRIEAERERLAVSERLETIERKYDPRGERERQAEAGFPPLPLPDEEIAERLMAVLEAMESAQADGLLLRRRRAAALLLII